MKTLPKLSATLLLTICGVTQALASTQANAYTVPNEVIVQNNNVVWIYFPLSARTGTPPACAANLGGTNFRYALDISTVYGRGQLAVLLAAAAAGIGVYFSGSGACTVDSATEDLAQAGMPGQ